MQWDNFNLFFFTSDSYLIFKMYLQSFSYPIWRFESYFWLFICLQKEKKGQNSKKCHAGKISICLFFFTSNPIQYLKFKFGIISISNVKIWKLFWTFYFLTKWKSSKLKKRRAGTISMFLLFFKSNSFWYLKHVFGIIVISYVKIWKILWTIFAYKSIENGKSRNSSRRDKNAYFCLPLHLGSWIQKCVLPQISY